MAPDGQNFRGLNAERLLGKATNLTIDKMISDVGYSHYLAAFDRLIPALLKDYNALSPNKTLKKDLT
jgi:hypothetical protein